MVWLVFEMGKVWIVETEHIHSNINDVYKNTDIIRKLNNLLVTANYVHMHSYIIFGLLTLFLVFKHFNWFKQYSMRNITYIVIIAILNSYSDSAVFWITTELIRGLNGTFRLHSSRIWAAIEKSEGIRIAFQLNSFNIEIDSGSNRDAFEMHIPAHSRQIRDILAGFEVACRFDSPSNAIRMFRMLLGCRIITARKNI